MNEDLRQRIQRMFLQDCTMAWFDVLLLWATIAFVLFSMLDVVSDPNIRLSIYIASGVLLLFNTASVAAMTGHYAQDKEFIYGLDIKHLDANRALAQAQQPVGEAAGKPGVATEREKIAA